MPEFKHYTLKHLDEALQQIEEAIYTPVAVLAVRGWCTSEPMPFESRRNGNERTFAVGDKWGDLFDCAWFHFTGEIPMAAAGQKAVLLLDVNGEMCVFDQGGTPVRGLTASGSWFDFSLGRPGKRVLPVTEHAQGGEPIDVWADAGCNDLFGNLQGNGTISEASIATCNDEVRGLFYDFQVLLDFLKVLPKDSPRYEQVLTGLNDVLHLLYDSLPPGRGGVAAAAGKARARLAPLLAKRGGDASLNITAIGHAHMDLAWLWPIRETIRKGARTFSTAIALIERYPDYVFGASQPQYFLWMKERYPALYAKIKEKVRQERIEPQGAMWVEADTNVSGGEALVRQILHGKRFFQKEFGVDLRYLWLPDVFGYSGALPQILKGADVPYFSTQKISWSLINTFPHHSFHWQGTDGSTVLAHMLPEDTYNGPALPRSVRKIEQNYKDKGVSEHSLMVFGIGDGGGGPGEEHLERLERIKNLEGLSPVMQGPVAAFFEKLQGEAVRFPTWVGELYLERHEGTLTTEARNKRYNRKMELALRDLEWSALVSERLAGEPYPGPRLEAIWREVLLYQFHDILPGSSIKRVYDESVPRYAAMLDEVTSLIAANDARLARQIHLPGMTLPIVVHNSLSWERTEWIQAGDRWLRVSVPPMGYKAVDGAQRGPQAEDLTGLIATESHIENDLLRVTFAADGTIASIYDKSAAREIIASGATANRLAVYFDPGDAWDFPMDYAEQTPRPMELISARAKVDGPRAIMAQTYRLAHSELQQEIILAAGSSRLDFATHLRWREPQSMLRTSFPVAIHADDATFEIQFGHIRRPTHRNTTWDLARDEVAAHKWVDLSQRDYGVALLNDCKYGHKVKGNVIDLNLLRSVPYPGPRLVEDASVAPGEPHHAYTDQCDHDFTYSLYPHQGDHTEGRVVQAAYALNVPLRVTPAAGAQPTARSEALPAEASFMQVDAPNVIVEAVKKAEDGDDFIVRLYECEHRSARATLRFGFPITSAAEASLMEIAKSPLHVQDNAVELQFAPFEIKTVRASWR